MNNFSRRFFFSFFFFHLSFHLLFFGLLFMYFNFYYTTLFYFVNIFYKILSNSYLLLDLSFELYCLTPCVFLSYSIHSATLHSFHSPETPHFIGAIRLSENKFSSKLKLLAFFYPYQLIINKSNMSRHKVKCLKNV